MATLRRRLHRFNGTSYDVVHFETEASLVKMSDGTTAEAAINAKAASSHTHDDRYYTESEVNILLNGKAQSSHNHSASNITSGVLPAARGGTGYSNLNDLKSALGITASDPASCGSGGTSGSTSPGGSMTFDNMSWIVVDNGSYNSNERVLILKDIYHLMNGYNIERFCTYFWNYVLSAEARAKCIPHCMKEFGVNAHTLPVFVPTYTECNGGFSYFNNNANRIAKYNGSVANWWTSSPGSSSYVYCVNTGGELSLNNPNNTYGFRPCVDCAHAR